MILAERPVMDAPARGAVRRVRLLGGKADEGALGKGMDLLKGLMDQARA